MATTVSNGDDEVAATPAPPPRPGGTRMALGLRALWTIVVLAIVAGLYAWYDQRQVTRSLRGEVAQRLTAADAAAAQSRERDSDLANQMRDAQAKLALLEARVGEFQSQQAALEALYRDLAPSRDELALAEVEQILVLASQQLSLAGNVHAALAGLQVADAKLAQLDRPQLGPLRRALLRDMDRLKAVPYVDVAGISIKLDQIIDAIDGLPLAKDERVAPPAASAPSASDPPWLRFLRGVWSDLHNVIRIEVNDHPPPPLVTPEQSFFLRENLRLRVLSARLALLARDDRSFKADLTAAHDWLTEYFDRRNRQVQSALATLGQLSAIAMPGEMPDLATSLDAVRALKAAADRATRVPAGAAR
jgi:uroporphyrin-3 C-methyltransferase